MPLTELNSSLSIAPAEVSSTQPSVNSASMTRKPPRRAAGRHDIAVEPLLTADDVAKRLNVSTDWVWDHSSRKKPLLPVIRMGDGTLRYRQSRIEAFIDERERVSSMGRRAS
jgi:predicted DNA-binding transcriptional regulator AlpA